MGGKNGLSIECVETIDNQGSVVAVSFEVLDSCGNLLGTFDKLGEAEDFIEKRQPRSKLTQ
jgi:hypothetical protein